MNAAARNSLKMALLRPGPCSSVSAKRTTWVMRHAFNLPNTPPGKFQNHPSELQNYQKYVVVEGTGPDDPIADVPLTVILNEFVDGYGNRGDVVEVPREFARQELLLTGKAVYASPFNLNLFEEEKQAIGHRKTAEIRLNKFSLTTARHLMSKVHLWTMNMEEPWVITKKDIQTFLRRDGIHVPVGSVVLPKQPINGPELELEYKLYRFYVVISRQIVVPCVGRLHHVTTKDALKIITPGIDPAKALPAELEAARILSTELYYVLPEPLPPVSESDDDAGMFVDDEQIWRIMEERINPGASGEQNDRSSFD